MSISIALAGKGGTGKTTMAGLLVKYLSDRGKTPVLAVDADANANLNEVLGLEIEATLGGTKGVGRRIPVDYPCRKVVRKLLVQQILSIGILGHI